MDPFEGMVGKGFETEKSRGVELGRKILVYGMSTRGSGILGKRGLFSNRSSFNLPSQELPSPGGPCVGGNF